MCSFSRALSLHLNLSHCIFRSFCLCPFSSVFLHLPLAVLLTLFQPRWSSLCLFLCLGLVAPERRGDLPPLNPLTLPWSLSSLTQAGHKDGSLKEAHFVLGNDVAVPALSTGLLVREMGWGTLELFWAKRTAPQLWSPSSGPPSPNEPAHSDTHHCGQMNILEVNSAGLLCLPKFPISLSICPNLTADQA